MITLPGRRLVGVSLLIIGLVMALYILNIKRQDQDGNRFKYIVVDPTGPNNAWGACSSMEVESFFTKI